jgi:predicted molibdopterin-dependent oxidoreductase YjgC
MSNDTCSHGPRHQIWRIASMDGPLVTIFLDGIPMQVRQGETVLAAVLSHSGFVRRLDSNDEPRAGFCLMGACQDCWVWFGPDDRGRACTTLVQDGMQILTRSRPEKAYVA